MKQIDIEEVYKEQLEQASKELAKDIDFQIIADHLGDNGWFKVKLEFDSREQSVDVALWVEKNCQGRHMNRGGTFVFEESKDALLFELKWL